MGSRFRVNKLTLGEVISHLYSRKVLLSTAAFRRPHVQAGSHFSSAQAFVFLLVKVATCIFNPRNPHVNSAVREPGGL